MHQAPKCQVMSYQVTLQLPAAASSSGKRFYPVTLCINPPTCRGYESRPSQKLYRAHHHSTQQVYVWDLVIPCSSISSTLPTLPKTQSSRRDWSDLVSSLNMALRRLGASENVVLNSIRIVP
ncbi:hypothetical protein FOCG_13946 [Fusarium oxysporum f. sp. radicis-lycopersici 26381]|uniref:Uncharacterized protein n=2 Tax=Fusarium oxysporum TaxID=5507 RepID=A0A0J9UAF7_FUSO4|nr:hypothetical protein FOXG_17956 [Fusarium oxysporum f. sp. lycopersici 4287]EXK48778.1 hypothetical protein FOMG_01572 [Fusarium oxysporum f. sp. melonis 26406]EXL43528.1 hypothetical protein FOCG_13946 [Fusarium oxysporum f. sp. radicis-lycopersici 26381]KNA95080.1 hypothetical protein FOXG_17956 [Fusarium oxysporum f. sp. lycopersici 4287]